MKDFEAIVIDVAEFCESGSGFDGDADVSENAKGTKGYVSASYHCMNEVGEYDGWIPFKVTIPADNPRDFKLTFVGLSNAGRYRVNKYDLRGYIEERIAYAMEA